MRKISFIISVISVFTVLAATITVSAAKPRLRGRTRGTPGINYSSVLPSRDTNNIIVNFTNLNLVKSNTYSLSYIANGIEQGVVGTIVPTGQTKDSRRLYIGTCSKGVCTPHYNIRNMILRIDTNLASGGTYAKRYRIKF